MQAPQTHDDPLSTWRANITAQQAWLLHSYSVFVGVSVVVSITMLASRNFHEWLSPHYGQPIMGALYLSSCCGSPRGILLLIMVYGIFQAAIGWLGSAIDNQFLAASVIQPIWTVGVPLIWFAIFTYFKPLEDYPAEYEGAA